MRANYNTTKAKATAKTINPMRLRELVQVVNSWDDEGTNSLLHLYDSEYNAILDALRMSGPCSIIRRSAANGLLLIAGAEAEYAVVPSIFTGVWEVAIVRRIVTTAVNVCYPLQRAFPDFKYEGKELSINDKERVEDAIVTADGEIVVAGKCRSQCYNKKDDSTEYGATKTGLKIGGTKQHKPHTLVFAAAHAIPLDSLHILTNAVKDMCDYYIVDVDDAYNKGTIEADYAKLMNTRWAGLRCGIDHISGDTRDNSVYNLQLVSDRTNKVLSNVRKCGYIVDEYSGEPVEYSVDEILKAIA